VNAAQVHQANLVLMRKLLVIVVFMLGFGFAMVPMYRQVCDALGFTQTRTVGSANTQVDASRDVNVELIASSSGLPWKFEAVDRSISVHPGEFRSVRYRVVNTLGRTVVAHAVMNTAPANAMKWIEKQECFCFTDQTLAPGESREMPVVFRVRAGLPKDMTTISLSYTFFERAKSS
jgi:cytochrome c oxidase assembly protein subunit 11